MPLLAAICGKDESLLRKVYPAILSKAVEGAGNDETSEFGEAVRTVFRSAESDEGRMRFLLVEQVRNESQMDFCIEKCLFENLLVKFLIGLLIGAGCSFALN